MYPLRRLRQDIKLVSVPPSIPLFKRIVGIAVTSNSYEQDVELRVLLYIKLDRLDLLFKWADALSRTVYENTELHYRMHQLSSLIRKYPLDPGLTGFDPELAARQAFTKAERRCERYNRVFSLRNIGKGKTINYELNTARNWIAYVLGITPDIRSIYNKMDFTEGASLGVHGNATNLARKLSSERWSVNPACVPYFFGGLAHNFHLTEYLLDDSHGQKAVCLDGHELWSRFTTRLEDVRYNKISFVPKTAKTHRAIAVEPLGNTFVQHGIDGEIRSRLLRVGLDLRDQGKNQELAYLGSIEQNDPYCTIDLSSASDTLATEVVRNLLPPDWFDLLNQTRSPSYQIDGTIKRYHKFVSMGNGFCFPLQTLIFASACHAAAVTSKLKPDFRVYGDDIIVRRSVFPVVIKLLKRLGFTPNPKKTFSTGPFRESCGADWHSGEDVRPIFWNNHLVNLGDFFSFHNESMRRSYRQYVYFEEIRNYLRELVPSRVRLVSVYPGLGLTEPVDALRIADLFGLKDTTHFDFNQYKSMSPSNSTFWVEQDEYLHSPLTTYDISTQSWRSYGLRSSAKGDVRMIEDSRGSSLCLMAGLRGASSAKPFTLRYSAQNKVALI